MLVLCLKQVLRYRVSKLPDVLRVSEVSVVNLLSKLLGDFRRSNIPEVS